MLTLIIAIGAAAGTALSLFLHAVAPKTKTTKDDWLAEKLDKVLAAVEKLK